jgi:hypothetical protein
VGKLEEVRMVWRAVDRPPCDELITRLRSPAARSRNLTMRRPRLDIGLLRHGGCGRVDNITRIVPLDNGSCTTIILQG